LIHLGTSFDEFVKHLYHADYYENWKTTGT
jgi:hypothetical protein